MKKPYKKKASKITFKTHNRHKIPLKQEKREIAGNNPLLKAEDLMNH